MKFEQFYFARNEVFDGDLKSKLNDILNVLSPFIQ